MSPPRYRPDRFPPKSLDWKALLPFISRAQRAIASYEGMLFGVPNPDILLSPLSAQEAVLSSRIEGMQSSLSEVLALDADSEARNDTVRERGNTREVLNYHLAIDEAIRRMEQLPLSQRVIRAGHAALMRGVRGEISDPGEYRRVENWIGPPNSTPASARLLTCPVLDIGGAMTAWERYLHEETPDALAQLAVVHAWFEAIHPFLDGNGRLGRLMIPLFLVSKGLLQRPDFYLSEYLERHRDSYYRNLLAAQSGADWASWLRFFLTAIEKQAVANMEKVRRILALYSERKVWIATVTRSQHGVRALDSIFRHPVFRTSDFSTRSGIPKSTALRILRVLRIRGMLRELRPQRGRRPAILYFPKLIEIAEARSDYQDGSS